jgi:hypothetical protein
VDQNFYFVGPELFPPNRYQELTPRRPTGAAALLPQQQSTIHTWRWLIWAEASSIAAASICFSYY